jgi:cupin 2 domain-containing protein
MAILAGFIDAIAGGGGLISLPALMYSGLPITMALGTNKFQNAFGMIIATYKYHKSGIIHFPAVYRGLLMGLIGAGSGAILLMHVSNHIMRFIVPILMLIVFVINLFSRSLGMQSGRKFMPEQYFFPLFGFILGFYDAFFGPGIGSFWIMAIVFFLGYTFWQACGYAKVLNLKSNLFALAFFLYYGQVDFFFGLIMAVGQLIGSYLGSHMVILKGSKLVRPFFMTAIFCNLMILCYQLLSK